MPSSRRPESPKHASRDSVTCLLLLRSAKNGQQPGISPPAGAGPGGDRRGRHDPVAGEGNHAPSTGATRRRAWPRSSPAGWVRRGCPPARWPRPPPRRAGASSLVPLAATPEEPERRPEARPRHAPPLVRPVLLQEPRDVGSLGRVRSDLERPGQLRPRLLRDAEPEVELAQRAARREGAGCERERRLQVLEGLLHAPGAGVGDREHGARRDVARVQHERLLEEIDRLPEMAALERALRALERGPTKKSMKALKT